MRTLRSSRERSDLVAFSGEKRGLLEVVSSSMSMLSVGWRSFCCISGCEGWADVVMRVSSCVGEAEASCCATSSERASGARCSAVGAGMVSRWRYESTQQMWRFSVSVATLKCFQGEAMVEGGLIFSMSSD